jgi:signal transduction histidine kinase
MVRRADLGVRGKVIPVERAVALLGFTAVRNAALSVQVFDALTPATSDERAEVTRTDLWKHSLAVACAADMLAERLFGRGKGGEAFVCGLLHDVGKIALDACLPKSYARVVEQVDRLHGCICDVERDLLGLDHTTAGRRLLTRWRLAQLIIDCAWLHHQAPEALPSNVADARMVGIIHLADNLVRRQRIGYSGYRHVSDVEELSAQLGLADGCLAEVAESLPERMEPYCAIVGLGDLDGRRLYAESLAKANKELGIVNAELAESNRSLQSRSACFEALGRFTGALTQHDRIEDVCAAAAESLRLVIGADCVVVAAPGASSRCLHVGCSAAGEAGRRTSIVDLGDSQHAALAALPDASAALRGIAPAPDGYEFIWRRSARSAAPGPLWLLPLFDGESMVGTAVFAAEREAVARFQSAAAKWEAVSAAMGLAVSSAKARLETERMTEELLDLNRRYRIAEADLARARSISMIAAMAAGAAHEMNNPLSVISGRAQMLQAEHDDPEFIRNLEIVVDQAQRASTIVTDLMSFAKPRAPEPVMQRLVEVFDSACQHWHEGVTLRDNQIRTSMVDDTATVYADPSQLREILDAVVANAVAAMNPETACLQVNSPSRASDETVRIVIEDNGAGMTRDVLEHALDPFFSHCEAGRGRGLGLSRAYRLAEINGGELWLDSTPKVGTTVTIELPARAPSA